MKRVKIFRCCCLGVDIKKLRPSLEKQLSVTIIYPRMRMYYVKHPSKDNALLFFAIPQNFTDTSVCLKCCLIFPDRFCASRFMFSDDIYKISRRLRSNRERKYLII